MVLKRVLSGLAISLSVVATASADTVEERVRSYFSDIPVMISIAQCESMFRQFAADGEPLHGGMDDKMVGIFQIYADVHTEEAALRSMDIKTVEGNLAYARHLYETQGTAPWLSSSQCWKKSASPSVLRLGIDHADVLALQKQLNEKGFHIAKEGPGSLGQETTYFGTLTRIAVRKYQCDMRIVCEGDESSTGYGLVGPKTKAALAQTSLSEDEAQSTQADIVLLQNQIAQLQRMIDELKRR